MGSIDEDGSPYVKVSLMEVADKAQKRLLPNMSVPKDKVIIANTYPMVLGSNPVQVLSHAPKRERAILCIGGNGVVAFGTSNSEVQEAQSAIVGELIGSVAYVNAPVAFSDVRGTTELWAGLVAQTYGQTASAAVATPAVPATGVAAQNPNAYGVSVVISPNGATITNVSVNGVTVGTAAGTYYVPQYGAISIAYSVASPTWVWTSQGSGLLIIPTFVSVIKEINT